jgi:branched-chain amino acid aminotransferase
MVNFNGTLQDTTLLLSTTNRSFLYGDGVFETVKVVDGKVLFVEDHYFRLMSSLRIVRMKIPMNFTLEYFESQILCLVQALNIENSARVRFTVFRNEGGYYTPTDSTVSFIIQATELPNKEYTCAFTKYEVDLYKDFLVTRHLLSTLKTNSKMIQITASIFAQENQLDSCLLINDSKNVVEATNGNLFMLMGNTLITPPVSEGCLNGIMRKQIMNLSKQLEGIEMVELPISPFDLQKADSLFVTNVVLGVLPITQYRKKVYDSTICNQLVNLLNNSIQ